MPTQLTLGDRKDLRLLLMKCLRAAVFLCIFSEKDVYF